MTWQGPIGAALMGVFRRPWLCYLLFIVFFTFASMCRWPIQLGDTDLWYHLNAGRYILQHHAIPHDSFFSFLEPPRQWVDYYWLFQVLTHSVFSLGGYHGLVLFRSGMYLAMVLLVVAFLIHGKDTDRSLSWLTFLGICYALVMVPRSLLVRPHLFSYGLIAAFLYILEYHPRRAALLVPLGVLWANVHGITYPVMALIVCAYGAESFLRWRRGGPTDRKTARTVMSAAALTLVTIVLTPHGLQLLRVPLTSTAGSARYILELMPLTLGDVLSFHLEALTPSGASVFNVLLFTVAFAWIMALAKRTVRLSHLVLGLGGVLLLLKGARFLVEFFLLSMPLLKAHPLWSPSTRRRPQLARPMYLAGAGLLLLFPLRVVVDGFDDPPAFPLSVRGLPQGVVAFLRHVDVGGTVLNHPNTGGYLQWELYPRYRIFADMEVPFLFHDEDIYFARHAFSDEPALRRFITRYGPSFITVPKDYKTFPDRVAQAGSYVLVFFDDAEALYVNRERHPELAERYALSALDPFTVIAERVEDVLEEEVDRPALMREVHQLLSVYPACGVTNQIAALVYSDEDAPDRVLPFAEAIIRQFPDAPLGYRLKGDALEGLGAYREAIAAYQFAMWRSDLPARREVVKAMGLASLQLGDSAKAYRFLSQTVDMFSTDASRDDLYQLATAARLARKTRHAEQILTYLRAFRISPDETEWMEKVKDGFGLLGVAPDEPPPERSP